MSNEHLVHAERLDLARSAVVGVEQGGAVGDHGAVDGVPVRSELGGHIADRTASPTDLDRRSPPSPIRDRQAWRGDPWLLMGPGPDPAPPLRATPAVLAPAQGHWPTEAAQVDQVDHRPVLRPRPLTAARTRRRLDGDHEATVERLVDLEHVHRGQTDQQLAHARALNTAGAPRASTTSDIAKVAGPLLRVRGDCRVLR